MSRPLPATWIERQRLIAAMRGRAQVRLLDGWWWVICPSGTTFLSGTHSLALRLATGQTR